VSAAAGREGWWNWKEGERERVGVAVGDGGAGGGEARREGGRAPRAQERIGDFVTIHSKLSCNI